jgi:hypothetical protein
MGRVLRLFRRPRLIRVGSGLEPRVAIGARWQRGVQSSSVINKRALA